MCYKNNIMSMAKLGAGFQGPKILIFKTFFVDKTGSGNFQDMFHNILIKKSVIARRKRVCRFFLDTFRFYCLFAAKTGSYLSVGKKRHFSALTFKVNHHFPTNSGFNRKWIIISEIEHHTPNL